MLLPRCASVGLLLGILLFPCGASHAAKPIEPPAAEGWLGLARVDPTGRAPFHPSVVFERYLWRRDAPPPKTGEIVRGVSGREAAWHALTPNDKGEIDGRGIAVAYATVDASAAQDRVWLVNVSRVSALYVNGVPVGGDVYGHGITRVPVRLRKGTNHLYAAGLRGAFRVRFERVGHPGFVARWDATLPDLVPGEYTGMTAGVLLVNGSEEPLTDLDVSGTLLVDGEDMEAVRYPLRPRGKITIPPLGTLKVALRTVNLKLPATLTAGWLAVVVRQDGRILENHAWELMVRRPDEPFRITFRSTIDDSAQFYAVRKPAGKTEGGPIVVLTLHGASVDAYNQARAYSARPGVWIVAPTNRRPFGFDWQDWGRQDAYEVMEDLEKLRGLRAAYLTGHSMGGHGAWHLAVNDPDRFRAVAPSAGWCSFDTYGARPKGALTDLWHAADAASNTESLLGNLRDMPIYVLHGTKDDDVPMSEAEHLVSKLEALGIEPDVHYAEGQGHWWDGDAAPGVDCVDWPGIFAMFGRPHQPDTAGTVNWITADVAVDAEHEGWRIEQPLRYGAPSSLVVHRDPGTKAWTIRTKNVRRLVVAPRFARFASGSKTTLSLDGTPVDMRARPRHVAAPITFERDSEGGTWKEVPALLDRAHKRPDRMGPFKRAFDNRFVLVYGTAGHTNEDAALLASARYDAEQWRYRANGHAECITDAFFLSHEERYKDRNVILYGNTATNAAWDAVLDGRCPIRAERGALHVGKQTWKGDALGLLLVYPRKDSDVAQVAVIGDTGVLGTRLGFRIPYFVSGVGIPDYVIYGPEVLRQGDDGVRVAGFFDHTWALDD